MFQQDSEIKRAIAECYRIFSVYPVPKEHLNVCTACCMSPEIELELRTLPLQNLSALHLYEYNTNSGAYDTKPSETEVKYFLPRLFELLSEGAELHWDIQNILQRFRYLPRHTFSDEEIKAINHFAQAFIRTSVVV